jgi:ribulose kinase
MAITASGEVVAVRQEYYRTDYPQPGFAEQNAEAIFREVVKLISEILKDCSSRECLGICFSAAMHSLLAVDVKGVLSLFGQIPVPQSSQKDSRKWGLLKNCMKKQEHLYIQCHRFANFYGGRKIKKMFSSALINSYR